MARIVSEQSLGASVGVTPNLLTIPVEIRGEIFKYLLLANCVKETYAPHSEMGHEMAPKDRFRYVFQLAILGTNQQVYAETTTILYEQNDFIVVSSNFSYARYKACEHPLYQLTGSHRGIPQVTPCSPSKFTRHYLRVHLVSPLGDPKQLQSFLMLAGDLEKLTRQIITCCFIQGFSSIPQICADPFQTKLQIRIPALGEPSLERQKRLLEPFKEVKSLAQQVSLFGAVDASYRAEILKAMTPPSSVYEAFTQEAFALYKLCKDYKERGDTAFKNGDLAFAEYCYICSMNILPGSCERSPEIASEINEAVTTRLMFRLHINRILLLLQQRRFDEVDEGRDLEIEKLRRRCWINTEAMHASRLYHYYGLGMAERGILSHAVNMMDNALQCNPGDAKVQRNRRLIDLSHRSNKPLNKSISLSVKDDGPIEEDPADPDNDKSSW
ncbi:hypothetical protein MMC09_003293 [Bachmanniomyces sp. S44760]|nr:hypothetical protein [Bachmanniomyces sp. S44760]